MGALSSLGPSGLTDTEEAIRHDVERVGRLSAVPDMLRILCDHTGMGFAAVARVTDGTWTACAVEDKIAFGLKAGGQLPVETTLCSESRAAREAIVIDRFSEDAVYRDHHTPRIYGLQSYVSVPIILKDDVYFGNLCAIDPRPAQVSDARTVAMFKAYAELIARQLEMEAASAQTETALDEERAQAKLREQFIAVLGHDLRNPLASVSAMAELLVRRTAEPLAAVTGQRIQNSTRRMSRLIDDILDFARGQLGSGMGIQPVEVEDLAVALGSAVSELRDTHIDRELRVQLAIDEPVRCDRGRLQQLVSNLVANALAHGTSDEPIRIEARTEAGHLVIAVHNGGEPIAPEHMPHIFEPYWRPAHSSHAGGLGLGLHICAQIVRAHGGSLTVSSSRDDGTRFVASMPVGGPG